MAARSSAGHREVGADGCRSRRRRGRGAVGLGLGLVAVARRRRRRRRRGAPSASASASSPSPSAVGSSWSSGRRRRRRRRRRCRRAGRHGDCVVVEGHGPVAGQRAAGDGVPGGHRDRRQGKDAAREGGTRSEGRGTAHLPEHVAGLGVVGEDDAAGRVGDERGGGLEDEDRVRVTARVQGQRPADLQRRGCLVHAGRERLAGADEAGDVGCRAAPGGIVVRGGQVGLGARRRRRRPCVSCRWSRCRAGTRSPRCPGSRRGPR